MSAANIERIKHYFETLTQKSVGEMGAYYTEDAFFRDPFNEVRGTVAIQKVFLKMWESLDEPRFFIRETVADGERLVLIWDFEFRIKRYHRNVTQRIHGLSVLRFSADGRIANHRDYWDAAGELYEKLPLVGALLRWLKRRMG